jgi:hypothetical protein
VAALVLGKPIAFIALHELEIYNALELKAYRKEATPRQIRTTRALLEADVREGILHRPALSWDDVLRDATVAATAHTRALGCRSLDVLHCVAARHLPAVTSFVTTDKRQHRLAVKLGLSCPVV